MALYQLSYLILLLRVYLNFNFVQQYLKLLWKFKSGLFGWPGEPFSSREQIVARSGSLLAIPSCVCLYRITSSSKGFMISTSMWVPAPCVIALAVRTFSSFLFLLRGSIIQEPVARGLAVFPSMMVHVSAGPITVSLTETLHARP